MEPQALEEGEMDPLSLDGIDKEQRSEKKKKSDDEETERQRVRQREEEEDAAGMEVYDAVLSTIRGHATNALVPSSSSSSRASRSKPESTSSASSASSVSAASAAGSKTGGGDWDGAEYWVGEHWRLALEELFYKSQRAKDKQDDMRFFVYNPKEKEKGGGGSSSSSGGPVDITVRRFRFGIPKDIHGVKWMESVYLNILLHTVYTCTVAVCSKSALEKHRRGEAEPALPICKTSRQVYASHTHISINLSESKAGGEPEMAYPQIYFAIDDFEDAFEDLIVEDEDHCLCVLLYARDGPTFSSSGGDGGGITSPPQQSGNGKKKKNGGEREGSKGSKSSQGAKKVSLFSGYVPYSHVWKAVGKDARGSNVGGFLGIGSSNSNSFSEKPEKLVMKGPGGVGHAEVAVTLLNRKSVHAAAVEGGEGNGEEKASERSKREAGGVKGFFSAMQSNASSIASSIMRSGGKSNEHVTQHIRCCLMNISLPWQSLCRDILK